MNGVLILQLHMHIVSLRENVSSKCLPTLCEHASENLNSLPRSSLIYLHYRLSTAVGGNHHGTKKRHFESKYKIKSEDGVCVQD